MSSVCVWTGLPNPHENSNLETPHQTLIPKPHTRCPCPHTLAEVRNFKSLNHVVQGLEIWLMVSGFVVEGLPCGSAELPGWMSSVYVWTGLDPKPSNSIYNSIYWVIYSITQFMW